MKTINHFILLIFLFGLQVINTYSQTKPSNVDSVYNLFSGNWYLVSICGGLAGGCDTSAKNDLIKIERIGSTDSITLKNYINGVHGILVNTSLDSTAKYIISFQKGTWTLSNSGYTAYTVSVNNKGLLLIEPCCDRYSYGFVRSKPITEIGNQTIDNISLSILPNPFKTACTISGVENMNNMKIIDISGKILLDRLCNASNKEFVDLSDYSKGIYVVQIISQGKLYVGKIIKE